MLEHELIPAATGAGDSRKLMVVLHGLGDSMEGYRWMPPTLDLPWLNYLLVNAPKPYFGGYSWYDFTSADPGDDVELSRKMLFALLDDQRQAGFAMEETVLFGFSQGCLMTIEVGLKYPHRFAGCIGVSGYCYHVEGLLNSLSPVARQQRFLLTHGRHDALIPIDPVRKQIQQLKAAGIQIEWREFEKDHTIAGAEEIACLRDFVIQCFGFE
jgi:phospholipase/carboxylesterase